MRWDAFVNVCEQIEVTQLAHPSALEISLDDSHHSFVLLDVFLDFGSQVVRSAFCYPRLTHIANDHLGSDVFREFSWSCLAGADFRAKDFISSLVNLFHFPEDTFLGNASVSYLSAYIGLDQEQTNAHA